MTAQSASRTSTLPVNDAPYTTVLYKNPATGRHLRTRLVPELTKIPFELCSPIRRFPAYRGRRSHQGKYWFSHSESHVAFESRFEMTALMVMDFRGEATAVSSNPFWLLWPKGAPHKRHAPDFFVRRRDGSVLVVDVKPADRITDKDRLQHDRTRDVCQEMGWHYEEFTHIDSTVERNLRLLGAYHHRRFAPPDEARAAITTRVRGSGRQGIPLGNLIDATVESIDLAEDRLICGAYHMVWTGDVHADLTRPLSWNTRITT